MPTIVVSGTIPAGGSMSSTIDASTGNPIFCIVPNAWTPANISFQLSADGITFGRWGAEWLERQTPAAER